MTAYALGPYEFEPRDAEKNFHGNRIVYLHWDRHLMFCSPVALPLPPDMPFAKLIEEVLPGAYSLHPDFEHIDWDKVEWRLNGQPFTPDPSKTLDENGVKHKYVIQFVTPGLEGIDGTGN